MNGIPWSGTTDDFDDMWENDTGTVPDIMMTMFQAQERQPVDAVIPCEITHYGNIARPDVKALVREMVVYSTHSIYEVGNADSAEQVSLLLANMWKHFINLHVVLGIDAEEVFRQFFLPALIEKATR
jgi:hypothetical protein